MAPVPPPACACPGSGAGGAGTPGHSITHGDLNPQTAPGHSVGVTGSPCIAWSIPVGCPRTTRMLGVLPPAAPQSSVVAWRGLVAHCGLLGTSEGSLFVPELACRLRHASHPTLQGAGWGPQIPTPFIMHEGQGDGSGYLTHSLGHGVSVGCSQRDIEDNDSVHHDHHRHHHEESQVPGQGTQALTWGC